LGVPILLFKKSFLPQILHLPSEQFPKSEVFCSFDEKSMIGDERSFRFY